MIKEYKNVLITGGSKGIGKSIKDILKFEHPNFNVYSISRTEGYNLVTKDGLEKCLNDYKEIDILINNIGGGGTWGDDILKFNEWDEVYEKNAGICRKMTINYLPYMQKQQWGRVITISSIYGKEKYYKPWFAIAKASEIVLMKCLAGKYLGITFNTICPGYIQVDKPFSLIPTKICEPNDVAHLVSFLCSDKAKHINGACITVDGGESNSF